MKQWEIFLQEQAGVFGEKVIDQWVRPLKVVDFDACNLYLEAKDVFQLNWFEEHFRPQIQRYFRSKNGKSIKVHLCSSEENVKKKRWVPVFQLMPDVLDQKRIFENYFPGVTNALSFSLLQEAIQTKEFNPIYIQGIQDSGKTHLLMACAHYFGEKALYVTADNLTNHIVGAIRSGEMKKLRQFYRSKDILLIDDVDKFMDRSATQEEFFHTFNALHGAHKQIILAGPASPSQLKGIEPRLTSRFEWGIILRFEPLSEADRKHFIQKRAPTLSETMQAFVLNQFTSVKLLQLALKILLKNKITSLEFAYKALDSLIREQQHLLVSSEKLIQAVAEFFEICVGDILGKSQAQECSLPRQIAMYLCRMYLKLSFVKIGKIFSRDHSTVMTCVKIIDNKTREQNDRVFSCINSIKLKFRF